MKTEITHIGGKSFPPSVADQAAEDAALAVAIDKVCDGHTRAEEDFFGAAADGAPEVIDPIKDDLPKPPLPSSDPATVAARLLVTRMLAEHPDAAQAARKPGSVAILVVASDAWEYAIQDAWREVALGGRRCRSEVCTSAEGRRAKTFRSGSVDEGAAATAILDGEGLLFVSADLDMVPILFQSAADLIIEMPPIDGAILRRVAETICGAAAATTPSDEVAAALSPGALRSSRRPGQTAADFLERAEKIALSVMPAPGSGGPKWTLDTLILPPDVDAWARSLQRDMEDYKAGKLPWEHLGAHGALLSGPPGCGKTTFAAALANSLGIPLIQGSYALWESGKDGGSDYRTIIKEMRKTFAFAKKNAPNILCIDEIDAFIARGKADHNESWFRPVIGSLLALSTSSVRPGVILLGATNLPGEIDPALRRPGRLDCELVFGLPDVGMIARILKVHLPELADADMSRPAALLWGRTGADCEKAARGARSRAREFNRPIEVLDLLEEVVGHDRRPLEHLRRAAYHECGHALASSYLRPGSVVSVSLLQSGGLGGSTATRLQGGSTLPDVSCLLQELLAGRAAEEVGCGSPSAGCGGPPSSDLGSASAIAASMSLAWGLGGSLAWRGDPDGKTLGPMLAAYPDVAADVEARLAAAYVSAMALLHRNRATLDALVAALLDRRVLLGAEVDRIVSQHTAPSVRLPVVRSAPEPEEGP